MANEKRRCAIERLEPRYALTQFGVPWPAPQQLTFSFVPDGTLIAGKQTSDLFASLNDASGSGNWQAAVMQAMQTWAANANVNFDLVHDGGQPLATPGMPHGDSRFGEIRFAAAPLSPDVVALGTPFSFAAGTLSGNIVFNSNDPFEGSSPQYDLFSVALHEIGHVLGVPDSTDPNSVMYSQFVSVRSGLAAGDIAAVDALYGPRPLDTSNQTAASATVLTERGTSNVAVVDAQLATVSDTHYYQYLTSASGPTTIVLHTAGMSLIEPQLTVYDSSGNLMAFAVSHRPNDRDLVVHVNNPSGNPSLLINVASGTPSVFGTGAYRLVVASGSSLPDDDYLQGPWRPSSGQNGSGQTSGGESESYDGEGGSSYAPPPRSSYVFQSTLATATDVQYQRVTAPAANSSGPLTLTASVFATQAGAAAPVVTVLDSNGNIIPAAVLQNDNGLYSVQAVGVTPGAVYTIAVASAKPTSTAAVGDYRLAVDFNSTPVALTTYAAGTLSASSSQDFWVLQVNSSQFAHLVLSATSPLATASTSVAVRMTIYDSLGNVIESVVAQAGSPLSTTLLLDPGTYVFRLAAGTQGSGPLPDTSYTLQGDYLSDPIGPQPMPPYTTPIPPPPPPFVFSNPIIAWYLYFLSLGDMYGTP